VVRLGSFGTSDGGKEGRPLSNSGAFKNGGNGTFLPAKPQRGKAVKTPTFNKSPHPTWNHFVSLEVKNRPEENLIVKVKNHTIIGKDKEVGKIVIPAHVWEEESRSQDKWYTLDCEKSKIKDGKIKMRVTYLSALRLTAHYSLAAKEYEFFVTLMSEKNYYFINMMCEVCKDPDLALAIIRIFNTNNLSINMINSLLKREVIRHRNSEGDPNTLFRIDSPTTRLVREYFHLISRWSYLRLIVKPILYDLIDELEKGVNFENGENSAKMIEIAERLINAILDSLPAIPKNMRRIFGILATLVKETYNCISVIPAVNLLFLRFLCPNVIFPAQLVLKEDPQGQNPALARPCVLLGKILQNTASGTFFNEDDPIMQVYNPIIDQYAEKISAFIIDVGDMTLVDKMTGPADDFRPQYAPEDLVKLMTTIIHRIEDNMDEILTACSHDPEFPDPIQAHLAKLGTLLAEKK